jgi:hypothetical protein
MSHDIESKVSYSESPESIPSAFMLIYYVLTTYIYDSSCSVIVLENPKPFDLTHFEILVGLNSAFLWYAISILGFLAQPVCNRTVRHGTSHNMLTERNKL